MMMEQDISLPLNIQRILCMSPLSHTKAKWGREVNTFYWAIALQNTTLLLSHDG